MKRLGVDKYAVSSTTVCEKNFIKALQEIQALVMIDGDRVVPIMWLSPEFFYNTILINQYLDSGIDWKCIKIHPDWQPGIWTDVVNQKKLLYLSKILEVPILIHTGGEEYSESRIWEKVIRDNPEQNFILAHCRPFDQALAIIEKYENAYGDLAFADSNDFKKLHGSIACHRILWGSDMPIVKHYIAADMNEYYKSELTKLQKVVSMTEYDMITVENFNKLFYLE